ncbi:XRE family transcriptional regulator, partial [Tersicoccus solisilvae]|uniref:XRE family transcriptional regulator n=1 Tax=Tersicoccus solisilvae TaxID=1882339 RepID=UPI00166864DC
MPEPRSTEEKIAEQEKIYGQSLADRFGAVMAHYGISNRRLAAVLGISAPMLSQLSSGQRIKIGNPVVQERLLMLERDMESAMEPALILERVAASQPVATTTAGAAGTARSSAPAGAADRDAVVASLRDAAGRATLIAAAVAAG